MVNGRLDILPSQLALKEVHRCGVGVSLGQRFYNKENV